MFDSAAALLKLRSRAVDSNKKSQRTIDPLCLKNPRPEGAESFAFKPLPTQNSPLFLVLKWGKALIIHVAAGNWEQPTPLIPANHCCEQALGALIPGSEPYLDFATPTQFNS